MRNQAEFTSTQLRGRAMSTVAMASAYARRLVEKEAQRSGIGVKAAIPSVARRVRAPIGAVWGLLFRLPKQVSADLLTSLEEAVAREIRREIAELENELATMGLGSRRFNLSTFAEVEADLARLRSIVAQDRP